MIPFLGLGPLAAAGSDLILAVDGGESGANNTVYTFAGKTIAAGSDQIVSIYATRGAAFEVTLASVTVGGVTASFVGETAASTGNQRKILVYRASGVSGTSADIVVTHDNSGANTSVVVLSVDPSVTVAVTGNQNTGSATISASPTVSAGDTIFGHVSAGSTDTTIAWTGLDDSPPIYPKALLAPDVFIHGAAKLEGVSAGSPTITATFGTAMNNNILSILTLTP